MIPPISSLPPLPAATPSSAATAPSQGHGFAAALGNAINSLQTTQATAAADEAAAAAGQGSLTNTMIAATEASLETQVATSLMNKALAAYTSVANMSF